MKTRQTVLLAAAAAAALATANIEAARCTAKTTAPATTTATATETTTETPSAVVDDTSASSAIGAEAGDGYTPFGSSSNEEPGNSFPSSASSSNWAADTSYASTASSFNTDTSYTSTASSIYSADESYASTTVSAASSTASSSAVESGATTAASTAASTASSAATTSTTSTSSGSSDHGTFGTITSGGDECVVGDPAEYISTYDVNWIWENRMKTDVVDTYALITDQIHANNGTLDYCVRWDSNDSLPLTTASKFQDALKRQYKAWNYWLIGYDCWEYDEIDINIVGIAVSDASLLDWTDDSLGKIYVGDLDSDGIPQCPEACYKHVGGVASSDTSSCTGTPFDMSLWPTKDLGGGYGSWWGQQVDQDNMLENIDEEELQILAHEIGHGFGLPDFYEDSDFPNGTATDFPACIMQAGASTTVTEGDGWMLRRVYENIKSRYD